jgi:hypothetical protein
MPMATSIAALDAARTSDDSGWQEPEQRQQEEDDQTRRIKAMLAGPPTQIIPLGMTDEWDLEQLMRRNFKADKYRIEVSFVFVKIWWSLKLC